MKICTFIYIYIYLSISTPPSVPNLIATMFFVEPRFNQPDSRGFQALPGTELNDLQSHRVSPRKARCTPPTLPTWDVEMGRNGGENNENLRELNESLLKRGTAVEEIEFTS